MEEYSLKGVGNLVRFTDRDIIYFHFVYCLVVLMTRHEVVNGSPTSTSFNFKKISQIIVKKDILILRIEDFQYSS